MMLIFLLVICLGIFGVVGAVMVTLMVLYNSLVKLRLIVDEATADIETFLKQRYDMIPNLVEIVKGYAKHEKGTFEAVTKLRSSAMNAKGMEEKSGYENQITQALKTVFALAENYPDLKANTNFLKLQDDLTDLEENIQKSRRFYNGSVRDYNTKIALFPANLIAGILGFTKRPFFEAAAEEKKNVKISFNDVPTDSKK